MQYEVTAYSLSATLEVAKQAVLSCRETAGMVRDAWRAQGHPVTVKTITPSETEAAASALISALRMWSMPREIDITTAGDPERVFQPAPYQADN